MANSSFVPHSRRLVLKDEWATSYVTLEDALSHRTGMPRHDLSLNGLNTTVPDVVRKLRYLPMTAEPRAQWQYCNMMYITVTHLIETYTGDRLGKTLRERIWERAWRVPSFRYRMLKQQRLPARLHWLEDTLGREELRSIAVYLTLIQMLSLELAQ